MSGRKRARGSGWGDGKEWVKDCGKERGKEKEKLGCACPGIPSPSGVHLVTHPLHRAQYMNDWRRGRPGQDKKN